MENATRAVLNTSILYAKMIITMSVTLLSTRWVLQALGADDFGIYNLVAGVIAMFSFLNTAMSGSTQRFMSHTMGEGNNNKLNTIFYYSVVYHLIIGVIVLILFEFGGALFLDHILKIPEGRKSVAMIVLHFLSISSFFTIISVPYQAVLNSHENMLFMAFVNIMESILKLVVALVLLHYNSDRLILYSFLMMMITIISMLISRIYCKCNYRETRISFFKINDKKLFYSMSSFAGWSLIGSVCNLTRNQGLAMLFNTFFGVVINAAYGIANQVNGQLSFFTQSITQAIRPQIVKSEGLGDRERVIRLSITTSKITFLILAFVAVPLIIEMPFVLKIWLDKVPEYTVMFCRLIIIMTMISQLSSGFFIAIEAVGRVKYLQIFVGTLHLTVLPLGFLCLKMGLPVYSVMVCAIIEEIIALFIRVYLSKRIANMDTGYFYKTALLPSVLIVILTGVLLYVLIHYIDTGFLRFFLLTFINVFVMLLLIWKFALVVYEKERIKHLLVLIKNKYLK